MDSSSLTSFVKSHHTKKSVDDLTDAYCQERKHRTLVESTPAQVRCGMQLHDDCCRIQPSHCGFFAVPSKTIGCLEKLIPAGGRCLCGAREQTRDSLLAHAA